MTKNKFSKPPLSQNEKEKLANDFLNFADKTQQKETKTAETPKKEPIVPLYLRVPVSFKHDIDQIIALTGLSQNAVCLELLRPAIKRKLKELKED